MPRLQCPVCLGIYDDTQRDGVRYFHACAPIHRVKVRRADGRVELIDSRMTVTETVDAGGGRVTSRDFAPPLPAGAVFLEVASIERPGKRDENQPGVTPAVPAPVVGDNPVGGAPIR